MRVIEASVRKGKLENVEALAGQVCVCVCEHMCLCVCEACHSMESQRCNSFTSLEPCLATRPVHIWIPKLAEDTRAALKQTPGI